VISWFHKTLLFTNATCAAYAAARRAPLPAVSGAHAGAHLRGDLRGGGLVCSVMLLCSLFYVLCSLFSAPVMLCAMCVQVSTTLLPIISFYFILFVATSLSSPLPSLTDDRVYI
jgi:hypothetical protein